MERGRAKIRKIVFANAWSERTKGDLGIMCGTIEMLRQLYPEAEITVLRMLGDHRPEADLRTLERLYGVRQVSSCLPIKLLQAAADLEEQVRSDRLSRARQALVLAEDLWGLFWATAGGPRLAGALVGRDLRATIRAIAEADLVVTKGGGYLNSPSLYADLQLLLPSTYTWWLAKQLRVPLAIIGQSVWSIHGPLSHHILRPLVSHSLVTTCREPESREHLLEAGYPAEKVRLAPCPSFAMARLPEERGREVLETEGLAGLDRPLVGVSIRYHGFGGDPGLKKLRAYLAAVAETVVELHRRYGAMAVVVPQNIPPGMLFYNDAAVNELFAQMVDNSDALRVVTTDYTPHDLVAFYSQLHVLLGTRLHACIFALRGYTPVVPIAYDPHKTSGIMSMLGLDKYLLHIGEITGPALTERVIEVWERRDQIVDHLQRVLPVMEEDAWNNVRWVDEALASSQGT